jgi:hypothetical protein
MGKKTYGRTPSGVPITDELIEKLSKEAEDGYDVDEILKRRDQHSDRLSRAAPKDQADPPTQGR